MQVRTGNERANAAADETPARARVHEWSTDALPTGMARDLRRQVIRPYPRPAPGRARPVPLKRLSARAGEPAAAPGSSRRRSVDELGRGLRCSDSAWPSRARRVPGHGAQPPESSELACDGSARRVLELRAGRAASGSVVRGPPPPARARPSSSAWASIRAWVWAATAAEAPGEGVELLEGGVVDLVGRPRRQGGHLLRCARPGPAAGRRAPAPSGHAHALRAPSRGS